MLSFVFLWSVALTIGLVLSITSRINIKVIPPCELKDDPLVVEELQVQNNATVTNNLTSSGLAFLRNNVSLRKSLTANNTSTLTGVLAAAGEIKNNGVSVTTENYVTSAIETESLNTDADLATNIDFNSNLSSLTQAKKFNTALANTDVEVYSYTGSGFLRTLWLRVSGINPGTVFIRVLADGEIVWGNLSTNTNLPGVNLIPLTCDVLLTPAGNGTLTYQTKYIGNNVFSATDAGGYFRMDIPFQSSLQIILRGQGANFSYWIQPDLQVVSPTIMALFPYKSYISTFRWGATVYNSEYPLLNVQGDGHGVYLFGLKFYLFGISGNWWESRFRVYKSDNGFGESVVTPATGFSDPDLNEPEVFAGAVNGEVVYISSGMEDFFLSSYNWTGGEYAERLSGLLYNSSAPGGVGSTSQISVYRFMIDDIISVPGSSYLSLTLPSGDPKVGMSGSFLVLGQCYYFK